MGQRDDITGNSRVYVFKRESEGTGVRVEYSKQKVKEKKRTVNTTPISKPEKVAGGGSRCENSSYEKQKGS